MSYTLTCGQMDWLTDRCDEMDLRLVADYAGRGHYGRPAVGIVCKPEQFGAASLLMAATLNRDGEDLDWEDVLEHVESLPTTHIDSFGLDSILYWPSIAA